MAGQRCTATSRVIVEKRILNDFVRELVARVRELRVGDGMLPGTIVGPLVSEAHQARVLDYVQVGLCEGAEVLTGGDAIETNGYGEGYFVAPTIFGGVQPRMRIMQEEIFGPVIGVIGAQDLDDAIRIANGVPYGLSASIATRNIASALHFADAIAAGVVHINRDAAKIDFHAPFGGMKASSAHNRNLGKAARDFFTETKTVYLRE
jgi:aldehyde dehydrogenase (NAD+)